MSYFTGGGTLASMQAVTGCTNAGDAENPGCGAEVPCKEVVSHVAQAEYTRYVAIRRFQGSDCSGSGA